MAYCVKKDELGWTPFIWLFYLVFFFFHPFYDHVGWKEWVATIATAAVFVALYFAVFFTNQRYWKFLSVAAIVLLGVGFAPFNAGASVFFIYAASFLAFLTPPRTAITLLAALMALAGLEAWLLHLPSSFLITVIIISVPVGAANIYFAQRNRANEKLRLAHEEIEHLAKVAERERIARDLHDVLGHTLSVIILKSELAGKLIDLDPARAKAEIRDVEQTSREALAEVRTTIRGYRAYSLEEELKQARSALETAGVTVKAESAAVALTPAQESVVALVVREAITNVVRHANARHCTLRLAPSNGNCHLEIQDDGRGGSDIEGNGLRGMRERVEALGGTLVRETHSGTRLLIRFPLTPKANGSH
ncbi:MAG TPA: sensor histidine kinase [Terriglobales bacterium]|jgi:two-component system sensor histidine kinase DesK|nr:sensor histidine kinase [Terriglobales bacterium]